MCVYVCVNGLRNIMGINYNTLATLTGSKPWCLFFLFVERILVGLFQIAVYPIVKKKKKKERKKEDKKKAIFFLNDRQIVNTKQIRSQRLVSLRGMTYNIYMSSFDANIL